MCLVSVMWGVATFDVNLVINVENGDILGSVQKSKVMFFERQERKVFDFMIPYKVRV